MDDEKFGELIKSTNWVAYTQYLTVVEIIEAYGDLLSEEQLQQLQELINEAK